jgi:hypothetical protein
MTPRPHQKIAGTPQLLRRLLLGLLIATLAAARAGDPNRVPNPTFADGLKHWIVTFPEPNETKYSRNHQWVSLVPDPAGGTAKVLLFDFPGAVAASEGVKAVTELIKLDGQPGQEFVFGADVFSAGPTQMLFLEGYQVDAAQTEQGNDHYRGYARSYRATLFIREPPGKWATVTRRFKLPKEARYFPTHVLIKLYAYHPAGKAYFRNVYLRPVEPAKP